MRPFRLFVSLLCASLLAAILVVGGFADAPASGSVAQGGAELWVSRYGGRPQPHLGPSGGASLRVDVAQSAAVSPDGSQVFVTGYSVGTTGTNDYATIAYDASTGAILWGRRYNGPGNSTDGATSVAVSPDGSKVFVTGASVGMPNTYNYATIAYDSSTGATLWVSRYTDPLNTFFAAASS